MSVAPNLRLWSVTSNVSSIIYGFAKADTKKKEVLTFYKFEQTVVHHMINIAGELLEDVNKHSCTGEPLWLWELLKQADVPVDKQHTFFQNYLKDLFGKYGY